jgi:hypothetical protein
MQKNFSELGKNMKNNQININSNEEEDDEICQLLNNLELVSII